MSGFMQFSTALELFKKYGDPPYPFHCEHDVLYVLIDPNLVSAEDKIRLEELGFHSDDEEGHFYSFRWGSA